MKERSRAVVPYFLEASLHSHFWYLSGEVTFAETYLLPLRFFSLLTAVILSCFSSLL